MKYRKKPVVIEAWRIPARQGPAHDLPPLWLIEALSSGHAYVIPEGGVAINTMEGTMTGNVGDWIIHGVKGELYPCKPDIFAATYESASNGPSPHE